MKNNMKKQIQNIRNIINRLSLSKKDKNDLGKLLSPISDEELDAILNGDSYYYYSDSGIGTWDIDIVENIDENEISS